MNWQEPKPRPKPPDPLPEPIPQPAPDPVPEPNPDPSAAGFSHRADRPARHLVRNGSSRTR